MQADGSFTFIEKLVAVFALYRFLLNILGTEWALFHAVKYVKMMLFS